MDESQPIIAGDSAMIVGVAEKRKRGRPPRGQAVKPPRVQAVKVQRVVEEDEEEDVCFICFDGGSLVLCDRKGCPKAYHPSCIKRDEEFFSNNAKWFCGWHICSVCQKASHYMCYTCTYSLCKGCTKNADYFRVRGKKGFCSMCMRTIMLIENKDQGNNEKVQVDFDDKGSWEYLFKLYWVYLRDKLSLTVSELIQAKNPEKESDRIQELTYGHYVANAKGDVSIMAQCKMNEKTAAHGTNVLEKLGNRAIVDQAVDGSGSETSIASLSTANSASTNISETDEVWHYRDPNGKTQGSFSMTQLRKWSKLGLFPLDMRIWTNDEYHDAVLLNDALNGLFRKAPPVHGKTRSQSQEPRPASDDRNGAGCGSSTATGRECREMEVPCHHCASKDSNGNAKNVRMDGLSAPLPKFLDLMNGSNSYSDKLQPSSHHGEVHVALPSKERGHENVELCIATGQVKSQNSDSSSRNNQPHNQSYVGQSSGQNWGSSICSRISINLDNGLPSGTNSKDSFEQKGNMNLPDRPSPAKKTSYDDIEAQAAEKLLSLSSGVPLRASDIQDWASSNPKSYGEAKVGQEPAGNKESAPKLSVQDSGRSWSSGSSVADEQDGNSPTTAEPSAEEWDSSLVSISSLKPAEAVSDHVATPTATPIADQLDHTSTSLQMPNLSTWQATVNEPIEFSTLAEESVSDLLAEVDAMESQTQSGMGSPTSAMRFSEQMIPGYKNFILALFEDLSPTHDPAKSDGLSSNGDIKLPCQSPVADELVGPSQADAFDPLKRSDGNSSNEQRRRN
ncbi:zinc finger CCCH domain-containing protein 44-like [Lycium ferocissimum]|uniref:zinc finger CCCH domain-containing protein 44-like n=1 Tax=Lycium ferocissimum TaxID=112874 RepID=UPI0028156196|nr:zinc finger CCCH domain-containing protein 44-like [Lycium ferocissimum]